MGKADLSNCFGCGKDNPIGLHLEKTYIDGKSHMEFEVKSEYCGYPGILHGGLICLLLDEVMYHAVYNKDIEAVTQTMSVDFLSPAFEGNRIVCEAWIVKHEGRRIELKAEICNKESKMPITRATGVYIEVDLEKILSK